LSGAGLTKTGTGTYTLAATSPTNLTTELEALTFTPTEHQVVPGQTVTTDFTLSDTNTTGQTTTDSKTSVVATAVDDPPTLTKPTLSFTVPEGQTLQGLYSQLLANVNDPDFGAQAKLTISSIGQPNTMGFINFNAADQLLTYTASGFNPNQPTDSFTYTVPEPYGGSSVTGTVDITVTGSSLPTQVGSNVTAHGGGQRLVATNSNSTLVGDGAGDEYFGGRGNDTITANGAPSTVYGGTGTNTITLHGAPDTVVLEQGGTDNISGFKLGNGDVLDLRQVVAEAQKTFSASDFLVTSSSNNATLSYVGTPSFTGGNPLATLVGVGSNVTLQTLISDNVLKVS
jgi:hypothetical protein